MALRRLLGLLSLALVLLGGGPALAGGAPVVLAAGSLRESLSRAADVWAGKGHPHPVLSFASSSALARQVMNGAPADLFVAADNPWMDAVARAGRIRPATRAVIASNRLVLIAPVGSRVRLTIAPGFPLAQALGPDGRLATGQVGAVPVGDYAKEALTTLKVWPQVAGRLAGVETVRVALALVARGDAPLGIVFATDAAVEPRVRVVGVFPEGTHSPIVYPAATLVTSTSPDAEGFRRFLLSGEGQRIFAGFGFGPARN